MGPGGLEVHGLRQSPITHLVMSLMAYPKWAMRPEPTEFGAPGITVFFSIFMFWLCHGMSTFLVGSSETSGGVQRSSKEMPPN